MLHIIDEFLGNLSCNLIQLIDDVTCLLGLGPHLRASLRELRLFYDVAFCGLGADAFFSIEKAWESFPNSNILIDYIYHIYSSLEPSTPDSCIFQHILLEILGPFLKFISDILFRVSLINTYG